MCRVIVANYINQLMNDEKSHDAGMLIELLFVVESCKLTFIYMNIKKVFVVPRHFAPIVLTLLETHRSNKFVSIT
jgi:hypothetical protein